MNLIPMPKNCRAQEGRFVLSEDAVVRCDEAGREAAEAFARQLRRPTSYALPVEAGEPTSGCVAFTYADLPPEAYRLEITPSGIHLEAGSPSGFQYATTTLMQFLPEQAVAQCHVPRMDPLPPGRPVREGWERPSWQAPCVRIEDAPRFGWRGFMLDCSRHFHTVEWIEWCLDLMAKLKMNRLHLHLSDNHGWRVEVPGWPRLTEVGSRVEPEPQRQGYYTADDLRRVASYAAARSIEVVPEIDVPGHIFAGVKSYPELCCTGRPVRNELSHWHQLDILCAGSERTFEFLEAVFGTLADLFPSPWVHLGGDEAPKSRWRECPRCQERIRTEGLAGEAELQGYVVRRVAEFLRSRGKRVIGWEEVLHAGLPSDAIVQWWRSNLGRWAMLEGLAQGHELIVSRSDFSYFTPWADQLDAFYQAEYLPPELLADAEEETSAVEPEAWSRVLGGECCMWTENTPSELLPARLLPAMLACAEVMWTYPARRDTSDLRRRALALETRIEGTPIIQWGS